VGLPILNQESGIRNQESDKFFVDLKLLDIQNQSLANQTLIGKEKQKEIVGFYLVCPQP
jgi:hypothetical protein